MVVKNKYMNKISFKSIFGTTRKELKSSKLVLLYIYHTNLGIDQMRSNKSFDVTNEGKAAAIKLFIYTLWQFRINFKKILGQLIGFGWRSLNFKWEWKTALKDGTRLKFLKEIMVSNRDIDKINITLVWRQFEVGYFKNFFKPFGSECLHLSW